MAQSNPALAALRSASTTVPTVFVQVAHPVGSGFIQSLAHPGTDITGFTTFEPSIAGKWLETIMEIAPSITRVAVIFNPDTAANVSLWRSIQSAAAGLTFQLPEAGVHSATEIERAIAAAEPNGGLIVLSHAVTVTNRELIVGLAARYRLPAVYAFAFFVTVGGLISYGIDTRDMFRRAAEYADRILRGAKAGELSVQAPTKFELFTNLRAAKQIDLNVPSALIARADEVIE